jgi:putative transposase
LWCRLSSLHVQPRGAAPQMPHLRWICSSRRCDPSIHRYVGGRYPRPEAEDDPAFRALSERNCQIFGRCWPPPTQLCRVRFSGRKLFDRVVGAGRSASMPNYRRRNAPGGTYFFTLVTENRQPILCTDLARSILHRSIDDCRSERPFDAVAMVLLPDHFHAIWTLPPGDADYSVRWARIKAAFTREWLGRRGAEQPRSASRVAHRRRGIWQRRFWEHHIRDAADYEKHLHYVHYNPVKHSLARCPHEYAFSTFEKWVRRRVYEPRWCCACEGGMEPPPSFDGLGLTAME